MGEGIIHKLPKEQEPPPEAASQYLSYSRVPRLTSHPAQSALQAPMSSVSSLATQRRQGDLVIQCPRDDTGQEDLGMFTWGHQMLMAGF